MTGGWRVAQKPQEHARGALVADPGRVRGCWGVCTGASYVGAYKAPRGCTQQAQPGKLTCHAHRAREQAAQALRAELEQEAAE